MRRLREAGLPLALVSNNVAPMERTGPLGELLGLFDAIVESSVEGVRKPEPEIYERALARLSEAVGRPIEAADCAYLDDLGINLKPARALGFAHDQGGRPGGRAGRAVGRWSASRWTAPREPWPCTCPRTAPALLHRLGRARLSEDSTW